MYCPCEQCGDFAVTPLIMPSNPEKSFCQEEPYCTPCMPPCVKVPVVYCCERPKSKLPHGDECELCCVPSCQHSCHETRQCDLCNCSRCRCSRSPCCASPPTSHHKSHSPERHSSHQECNHCCDAYCRPPCKPVRTKYVIPCYRYEDGRIVSPFTCLRMI